jgi:uncharacterized protein (TIGR04552 family)
MLRGDSVIDWHRLNFADHAEVDRFLRLNEFDPESDAEMDRFEDIRSDAVDYLARAFAMAIPDEVAADLPARDLFLVASSTGPHQKWACVVLKVMHIIHHINGRQALLKVSVSDEIIFREIEMKVLQVVEQLRAAGAPLLEFEWSRKPRDSQITKLLAKKSTLAASIYDKLRFRLIVPTHADIIPMLATLARQLIPFNYVVPGETVNQLIDLKEVLSADEHAAQQPLEMPVNEFSGPEYRIINFVADLPLRLERLVPKHEMPPQLSHVVFVLTEFQVCDKATAQRNESGASSHEAYKQRQHERVRMRLFRDKDDPLPPD